ncbi:MAG: hypothetical protein SFY80_07740 [Verrucomicrobiota bacterium]|nr:hypothetical protein [Verrucomicrobiota bacterium]
MKTAILKSNIISKDGPSYICIYINTEDDQYWEGLILFLSKIVNIKNPIIKYTLEVNRLSGKLENHIKQDSFLGHVSDWAKGRFDINLFQENEDLYYKIMMGKEGVIFDTVAGELDPLVRLVLDSKDEQLELIEKFVGNTMDDNLRTALESAKKLRRSLKIDYLG